MSHIDICNSILYGLTDMQINKPEDTKLLRDWWHMLKHHPYFTWIELAPNKGPQACLKGEGGVMGATAPPFWKWFFFFFFWGGGGGLLACYRGWCMYEDTPNRVWKTDRKFLRRKKKSVFLRAWGPCSI